MSQMKNTALAKIKSLYGTPQGEFGPTLFVSHHLDEIEKADWLRVLKTENPTSKQVLDSLVLVGKWSSTDSAVDDIYDFSLPDNLTNYLLSVHFSENGTIEDVSMES